MKKTVILTLLTLLAVVSVRADLIWYEGFNYADGSLTNVSGGLWIKTSGTANPSDMYVKNKNLEVSATGGSVSRQDDCYRLMATTAGSPYTNLGTVVYASFTVICTNLPNGPGSYFATFDSTAKGFCGRVQAFTNGTVLPRTWRLGVTANGSAANPANGGYPVDLALNTPYQVVEELDPVTLQAATIWVNPVDLSDTGASGTDRKYTSSDSIGFQTTNQVNAYLFRQASSFGNSFFQITNLALATTFAEAATNIWTTNAFSPAIVYQPVGVTNFVGAAIALSAVANGQGLGNMTYQWQRNGGNYTGGSGGTANVLTISSAQTTDNGDFTLIATTPYGLSATSSVAKVSISAAPVPPSFVTQPVSQTAFNGQNASFSTTVLSPGNVTFTWYSNNVVVTDGVNNSGDSSSLLLINVTTNFAASYKVAVTNDVVANGIVSTNAVLTVIKPPVVSIAYLRTLVDPTTYAPTNIPATLPYQITGVVTTFTNTTTGDTASYFLQDATAGINIFATFGSTFRPAQGDVVTFIGVLSSFSTTGLELFADTQARTYTSYSIVSNNFPLPTPIIIPFDVTNNNYNAVNYTLAGSLVTLTNVYFGTNAGNTISTTANTAVTVTNAIGQSFKVQFFNLDLDTAGQTLPAFATSVTGVLYGFHPNFSVAVTKFSDIVSVVPSIPLGVSFSGGTLTFNWTDPAFSLQSATNVAGPYTTITGAASGFTTNTAADQMYFRLFHP